MSERKVINKYIPPDFDPNKANRNRHGKGHKRTVRLMAPYSMQCNSCGEFIYKGKKFNARKEIVQGEQYYGIPIFRFYIKCTRCTSEITFRTDPKNTDYAAEHGAIRNFEPWRDNDKPRAEQNKITIIMSDEEDSEPEIDPMKALEQRTIESQREMEIMDALQDIRTRNARHERVDPDAVIQELATGKRKSELVAIQGEKQDSDADEDEALVQKYFGKRSKTGSSQLPTAMQSRFAAAENSDRPEASVADEQEGERTDSTQAQSVAKEKPNLEKSKPNQSAASATEPKEPTAKIAASDTTPAAISLLSEASRAQIQSLASNSTMPRPMAKKRRGPNALGLVRK
ncbi:Pre-mRNA-splicing factor cwf16 [Malassezia yamatoensis]|uniref:Splicing factor YJU2 n=1 Tax=Malassezia yamatoensis TaxID=253288 RepID=A0AAJ5YPI1_9BASI|nr:Pre-mRNA-splicing factor cwf16 [Malassezia yamatoensis]